MGDNNLSPIGQGSSCPSVLRPQGRRKGISLDPEIFGIEGHPEGHSALPTEFFNSRPNRLNP